MNCCFWKKTFELPVAQILLSRGNSNSIHRPVFLLFGRFIVLASFLISECKMCFYNKVQSWILFNSDVRSWELFCIRTTHTKKAWSKSEKWVYYVYTAYRYKYTLFFNSQNFIAHPFCFLGEISHEPQCDFYCLTKEELLWLFHGIFVWI